MKRTLLLVLICGLLLCGCGFGESRVGYPLPGTLVKINNDETVTVVDASIEDGKITVVLDVRFKELKLFKYFERIIIRKSETGSVDILCNIDQIAKINKEEVFTAPYIGEVTLVFMDDSIHDEHELWTYIMYMEYTTENGVDGTKGFCLGKAGEV